MKVLLIGCILLAIGLACGQPPPAPATPPPTPEAMPSAIMLSLTDCEAVIVHIPYSKEYVAETVREATGASDFIYPLDVTIEGVPTEAIEEISQIVARCYHAVHNHPPHPPRL